MVSRLQTLEELAGELDETEEGERYSGKKVLGWCAGGREGFP